MIEPSCQEVTQGNIPAVIMICVFRELGCAYGDYDSYLTGYGKRVALNVVNRKLKILILITALYGFISRI
jgi:hypothetical protein